jgi:hypothetical protein
MLFYFMETEIKNISPENNVLQFERFVDPELRDDFIEREEEKFEAHIIEQKKEMVMIDSEQDASQDGAPSLLAKELGDLPLIEGYIIDQKLDWKFNLESERFEAGVFLGGDFIIDTLTAFGRYEAKFFDPVQNQDKVGIYEMDASGRIRLTIAKKDRAGSRTANKNASEQANGKAREIKKGFLSEAFENYNVIDFLAEKNKIEQKNNSSENLRPVESIRKVGSVKYNQTSDQVLPTSINEAIAMRLPDDPIRVTVPIAENANGIVLLKVA